MTSKVKINRIAIAEKVQKAVNKVQGTLKNTTLLNDVADEIIKDNRRAARTGKGFSSDATGTIGQERSKMPALAPKTIEHRKYLARAGNATSDVYSLRRSNLSISDQLLSSFVKKIRSGVITISLSTSKRAPYKTLGLRKTKGAKSPPSNAKVADALADMGRHFLGIDNVSEKKIRSIIVRFVRRLIKG